MADRLDSELLRGFCDGRTDGQTDWQTDICDSRVAFATEKVWNWRFSNTCCLNLKANKCLIWVDKNTWIWFYLIIVLELDLESIMSSLRMDLEK